MNIKLGDLGVINTGNTPSMKIEEFYSSNDIPFIKPDSFGDMFRLNPSCFLASVAEEKARIVEPGAILVTCIGTIGKVAITNAKIAFNQQINSISVNNNFDSEYIAYNILFNKFRLQSLSNSAVVPIINKSDFSKFEIKVEHNLEKQIKIKKWLNKVNQLKLLKEEQIRYLDLLIKSRFIELFGDPNNPYNVLWPIVPISKVTDCMVPGRDKPKSFTGTIPWITIDDLIVNNTTEKSKNNIGLTVDEIKAVKRKCIPSGSIIMSCVGNLGLCSISACELVINQQLHSFQCKSMVDNFYLMYYLSFLKGYMNKMATNTTVLYMNKTVCNSIPVILPPIELQHKFSKFLNKINKLKFAIMVYN